MKRMNKKQLLRARIRDGVTVERAFQYVIDTLAEDRKHSLVDEVVKGLTFEEIICLLVEQQELLKAGADALKEYDEMTGVPEGW